MSVIAEVVTAIAIKTLEKGVEWLHKNGLPIPTSFYVRALAAGFRDMPFIYKDLPLDVLQDFVETDLAPAKTRGLGSEVQRAYRTKEIFRPLRDYRHIVLSGDAGMGKTTLFRLAVQSIAKNRDAKSHVALENNLVPFFVPLKAIDNNSTSPILRYLFTNVSYLKGPRGPSRLLSLARRGRVMLLFDAYDEMPYVGGTRYIQDELAFLLDPSADDPRSQFTNREFREIYLALRTCRMWISSRREFLKAFPLASTSKAKEIVNLGFTHQRIQLVKKIFDRYRERGGAFFADRLDEEDFMQQLSIRSNSVVEQLSRTPLFLTVLCYTYAAYVREERDTGEMWRLGQYELIEICLGLLLVDIDEMKTRGYSALKRKTLLNRRAAFTEEKLQLLRYLAAKTYLDRPTVIYRGWLVEEAKMYFSQSIGPNAATILRGLDNDDPTTNIVDQLILSDVFLRFADTEKGAAYEFPHARFREALATDYFSEPENIGSFFARQSESQFAELTSVFVDRFGARSTTLEALKSKICGEASSIHDAPLLQRCLEQLKSAREVKDHVLGLVLTLARDDERSESVVLPADVLQVDLAADAVERGRIRRVLEDSIARRVSWLLALSFPLYASLSRDDACARC